MHTPCDSAAHCQHIHERLWHAFSGVHRQLVLQRGSIQLLRLVIHVASKDERCTPEACLRRWQCSSPSQKNGGFHGYVSGVICGTSLGLAALLQAALLKSVRKGAGGLPCHFHAVGMPP